jgi:hypothetical protein
MASTIEYDKLMMSAARDRNEKIFVMAAQREKKRNEVCISIAEEYMTNEDLEGLNFIYKFYVGSLSDAYERASFVESLIPLNKIKLIPVICEKDPDIIPDILAGICKYNSLKTWTLMSNIALDLVSIKQFMLKAVIYNRVSLLKEAVQLYELIGTKESQEKDAEPNKNDDEEEDENIYEMIFMTAVERDYAAVTEFLFDIISKLPESKEILAEALDITSSMGHDELHQMLSSKIKSQS